MADEAVCILCVTPIQFAGVGVCNHNEVCDECVLRLRELYDNKNCSVCKTECAKVVFTDDMEATFDELRRGRPRFDKKLQAWFTSDDHRKQIKARWAFRCPMDNCDQHHPDAEPFRSLKLLKNHLRTTHHQYYCDTCLDQRKVFFDEQLTFTKKRLNAHMRHGDTSTGGEPHPRCEFCNAYFFDKDALYHHMTETHELCFVCQEEGRNHQYFASRDTLVVHLHEDHYACPIAQCVTSTGGLAAYRTEAELKAHMLRVHGERISKTDKRRMRQLDVNITFSDGPAGNRRDGGRGGGRGRGRGRDGGRGRGRGGGRGGEARTRRGRPENVRVRQGGSSVTVIQHPDHAGDVITGPHHQEYADDHDAIQAAQEASLRDAPDAAAAEQTARVRALVAKLKTALGGDEDAFATFKSTSQLFREGAITVPEYYHAFVGLLGASADDVFEDLVATLPDREKVAQLRSYRAEYLRGQQAFPTLGAGHRPAGNRNANAARGKRRGGRRGKKSTFVRKNKKANKTKANAWGTPAGTSAAAPAPSIPPSGRGDASRAAYRRGGSTMARAAAAPPARGPTTAPLPRRGSPWAQPSPRFEQNEFPTLPGAPPTSAAESSNGAPDGQRKGSHARKGKKGKGKGKKGGGKVLLRFG